MDNTQTVTMFTTHVTYFEESTGEVVEQTLGGRISQKVVKEMLKENGSIYIKHEHEKVTFEVETQLLMQLLLENGTQLLNTEKGDN